MTTVLYRYDRNIYSEEFDARLILRSFPVIKETEKGFWILVYGSKKWTPNDTKKRYAYPTKEEAYINFQKRTERCIKILSARLRQAKAYLELDQPLEVAKTSLNK